MFIIILMLTTTFSVSAWDLFRITDDYYYAAEPSIALSCDTVAIAYESYAYGNDEIVLKYSTDKGLTYSLPVRISVNDSGSWRPKLSINNGFDIVWEDNRTGKRQVFYSRYANGVVSTNLRISSGSGTSAFPSVAIDGSNVFVVWEDSRDGNDEIYFRKLDGGTWSAEKRLTNNDSTSWGSTIAYDKQTGMLHVAFFDYRIGNDEIYYISSSDRGTTWTQPVNISNDDPNSWEPRIAAQSGNVALTWYSYNPSTTSCEVFYSFNSGAGFSVTSMLSPAGSDSKCPSISMNASSTAVAWEDYRDGNDEIYVASKDNNQDNWIEERVTNDIADSFGSSIAWGSDNLFVTWFDYRDKVDQIYAAKKSVVDVETFKTSARTASELSVLPNPFSPSAFVRMSGTHGNISVSIIDITGKTVKKIMSSGKNLTAGICIEREDLGNGLYIVKVNTENKSYAKKISIVR
jgi:hypothetical protein